MMKQQQIQQRGAQKQSSKGDQEAFQKAKNISADKLTWIAALF